MKLYMKGSAFYGESNNRLYYFSGPSVFGREMTLFDNAGSELASVKSSVMLFYSESAINIYGSGYQNAKVKNESVHSSEYNVESFEWTVTSQALNHEFSINSKSGCVADISKEWRLFGERYTLDIYKDDDIVKVICVFLAVCGIIYEEKGIIDN